MKNNFFYGASFVKLAVIVCFASAFVACNDDKDTYDFDGMGPQLFIKTMTNNSINGGVITHTPAGSFGDITVKFPVSSTYVSKENVSVACRVDNSLIESYNSINKTNYLAIPDGLLSFDGGVEIPVGKSSSADSVLLSIAPADLEKLSDKGGYLIPVRIESTTVSGIAVNPTKSIAYVFIKTQKALFKDNGASAEMLGSLIADRKDWALTTTSSVSSGTASNAIDGSSSSYWTFGENPFSITVDLNKEYSVTGFRWSNRYGAYGDYYRATSVVMAYSSDNVNFTEIAPLDKIGSESNYQFACFYGGVKMRYLKLTFAWNAYRTIGELDFYHQ